MPVSGGHSEIFSSTKALEDSTGALAPSLSARFPAMHCTSWSMRCHDAHFRNMWIFQFGYCLSRDAEDAASVLPSQATKSRLGGSHTQQEGGAAWMRTAADMVAGSCATLVRRRRHPTQSVGSKLKFQTTAVAVDSKSSPQCGIGSNQTRAVKSTESGRPPAPLVAPSIPRRPRAALAA